MKSTSTFGIQFIIRVLGKTRNTDASIYARITVNGQRTEISLKKKIDPKAWDDIKGRAKGKRHEIVKLNNHLERVRSIIADGYHNLVQQRKTITVDAVKRLFMGEENESITLQYLMNYHNEVAVDRLAPGTMKNYGTTQGYLSKLLKEKYYRNDILLCELNYKFLINFESFLIAHEPKDHQRPLSNNGIMKHIERFRKMVNMAIALEWLSKDPFASFKKHFDKVERQALTPKEMEHISKKEFKIERLRNVRDMFLFSCYTGLSYIDLAELQPDNVVKGIDGEAWLKTSRTKTNTTVNVPLLPAAYELIELYSNHPTAVEKGTIFPVISNQRMNGYLKEIADICGVTKRLTFHIARHTFATTITLSNGVPIESVSKMLGHTTIRTTQIYAKVIENKLSEDMGRLKQKLAKAI